MNLDTKGHVPHPSLRDLKRDGLRYENIGPLRRTMLVVGSTIGLPAA